MHATLASDDVKIDALKKQFSNQVGKLENSLVKMQKELEEKNSVIIHLIEKFDIMEKTMNEKQFENVKDDLKDKEAKINGLEIKLEEMEKSHQEFKK